MKTLNILALAFALAFTPVIGSSHESGFHTDSIAAKIQSTIHHPGTSASEDNQRVFVVFSIDENGLVTVHEIGTADEGLKSSIVAQFQSIQFDNSRSDYDGMYSIWLNFKTL